MIIDLLRRLWSTWEIQVLVLASLFLQILLLTFAGYRKHIVPIRMSQSISYSWCAPLAHIFHWLLWLAYLSADSVAIFAIGYLSNYEQSSDRNAVSGFSGQSKTNHLHVFWAPFLILHLGGQDTITALSIEDNELWMRHLLTLVYQVGLTVYVFCKSNPWEGELWPAVVPMFIAGTVKYFEIIWSLQQASMSGLWSSINVPEPNPNHAKMMKEVTSNKAAGLPAEIIDVRRPQENIVDLERQTISSIYEEKSDALDINEENGDAIDVNIVLHEAYRLFQMIKGLFVDLDLSRESWEASSRLFRVLKRKEAYKIIEIELSLMYDMLHSKAALLHTWYGCFFRVVTLMCTSTALCVFVVLNKSGFAQNDIVITYVLLGGAIGLEIIAIFCIFVSAWTYGAVKESGLFSIPGVILSLVVKKPRLLKRSLWSNQMGQYSLITRSRKEKPCLWRKTMTCVGLKEHWYNYRYTTYVPVEEDIKILVFDELKSEINLTLSEHRGQWSLLREGYYYEFCWSIETEFDKSILIWHIATDLLFHKSDRNRGDGSSQRSQIGQHISNYMLFLLISRPFMLPAGIGKIRFEATCVEARTILKKKEMMSENDEAKWRNAILENYTEYDHSILRYHRNMSVILDGCRLAQQLQKEFGDDSDRMWKLINAVWVEMLCFAANNCRGQFHAKQLSKGGEFLTTVWILVAHLGLGDLFKVEMDTRVAKLCVRK
ncbi:hypothetical protein LUZ62_021094 [Rhynchospora pubera]|uniref:DUF4220 domain-containing protein n=1 Tax=Rhynchospora pubera TaxID=906938 RepID=A0AAV8GSB0_9POAL|nr:hypothetical protein LUZ62_021094 [Rhynchospora pubera]